MSFIYYNPNPERKLVGDCVIRAISKVTNQTWEDTYTGIMFQGFIMHDMPSSNDVWGRYLFEHGFKRYIVPDTCPDCYTVADFAIDHPRGIYILGPHEHAVALIDGNWWDSWDSGLTVPTYYFRRI